MGRVEGRVPSTKLSTAVPLGTSLCPAATSILISLRYFPALMTPGMDSSKGQNWFAVTCYRCPSTGFAVFVPLWQGSIHISDLFLRVCSTMDCHAPGRYSAASSRCCSLKNLWFSAAGSVAERLCAACCRGLVLIANILCSLFNLSAIDEEKNPD